MRDSRKGFALIIVLVLGLLILTLGSIAAKLAVKEVKVDRGTIVGVEALNAAESGVEDALARLKSKTISTFPYSFNGTVGDAEYEVKVFNEGNRTYKIESIGRYKDGQRKIITTVEIPEEKNPYYPFAAKGNFRLDNFSTSHQPVIGALVASNIYPNKDEVSKVFSLVEKKPDPYLVGAEDLGILDEPIFDSASLIPSREDIIKRVDEELSVFDPDSIEKRIDEVINSYLPEEFNIVLVPESECDYGNYSSYENYLYSSLIDRNGDGKIVVCGEIINLTLDADIDKDTNLYIYAKKQVNLYSSDATVRGNLNIITKGNLDEVGEIKLNNDASFNVLAQGRVSFSESGEVKSNFIVYKGKIDIKTNGICEAGEECGVIFRLTNTKAEAPQNGPTGGNVYVPASPAPWRDRYRYYLDMQVLSINSPIKFEAYKGYAFVAPRDGLVGDRYVGHKYINVVLVSKDAISLESQGRQFGSAVRISSASRSKFYLIGKKVSVAPSFFGFVEICPELKIYSKENINFKWSIPCGKVEILSPQDIYFEGRGGAVDIESGGSIKTNYVVVGGSRSDSKIMARNDIVIRNTRKWYWYSISGRNLLILSKEGNINFEVHCPVYDPPGISFDAINGKVVANGQIRFVQRGGWGWGTVLSMNVKGNVEFLSKEGIIADPSWGAFLSIHAGSPNAKLLFLTAGDVVLSLTWVRDYDYAYRLNYSRFQFSIIAAGNISFNRRLVWRLAYWLPPRKEAEGRFEVYAGGEILWNYGYWGNLVINNGNYRSKTKFEFYSFARNIRFVNNRGYSILVQHWDSKEKKDFNVYINMEADNIEFNSNRSYNVYTGEGRQYINLQFNVKANNVVSFNKGLVCTNSIIRAGSNIFIPSLYSPDLETPSDDIRYNILLAKGNIDVGVTSPMPYLIAWGDGGVTVRDNKSSDGPKVATVVASKGNVIYELNDNLERGFSRKDFSDRCKGKYLSPLWAEEQQKIFCAIRNLVGESSGTQIDSWEVY